MTQEYTREFVSGMAKLDRPFEMKYTPEGKVLWEARVEFIVGNAGSRYGNVTAWEPTHEMTELLQSLPAPGLFLFQGSGKVDAYTDREGKERKRAKVNISAMAGPALVETGWIKRPPRQEMAPPGVITVDPDEIPF
jgi:hypothetical protein